MKLRFPSYDAELVAGIEEHLRMDQLTAVYVEQDMLEMPGCVMTLHHGVSGKLYNRPMIQAIPLHVTSAALLPGVACSCGDFSRSRNCPDHPERPVEEWLKPPSVPLSVSAQEWTSFFDRGIGLHPCAANPLASIMEYERIIRYVRDLPEGTVTVEGMSGEGSFSFESG